MTATLSKRETELMRAAYRIEDAGNKALAAVLHLAPRTVDKHFENISRKLKVQTRTSALLKWLKACSVFALVAFSGCTIAKGPVTLGNKVNLNDALPPLPIETPVRHKQLAFAAPYDEVLFTAPKFSLSDEGAPAQSLTPQLATSGIALPQSACVIQVLNPQFQVVAEFNHDPEVYSQNILVDDQRPDGSAFFRMKQ